MQNIDLIENKIYKFRIGYIFTPSDFTDLLNHDRETFQKPDGWQNRELKDSVLISDFHNIWGKLQPIYSRELPELSYQKIPAVNDIENTMKKFIEIVI